MISDTKRKSKFRAGVQMILKKRTSKLGFAIVGFFVVLMVAGPFLIPYSPDATSPSINSPPSASHPFGTDYLGHDVLSQDLAGTYSSMAVGILGAVGAVVLGSIVGVMSGYFDKLEVVLTGSADIVMTFPALPLMVVLGSLYPPTDELLILIMIVVLWPPIARSIRSQVLFVKKLPYIDSAKVSGLSSWRIIRRIVVPEVTPIAIAYFVLTVATAIVLVAALQFLGVGNPDTVSWGSMLFWAQQFAFYAGDWWWILAPGLSITLLATGLALIGFSVEEVSNPRLRNY